MYKTHVDEKWLNDNNECPVNGNAIVLGVTLPAVSYQPYKFGASQVITARSEFLNENVGTYIVSVLKKYIELFSYNAKPGMQIYKDLNITLPTQNGYLAIDYMEQYISLLEEEKMLQVDKFLKDSGLNDTALTEEESAALERFRKGGVKFVERKIGELFDIQKGKRLTKENIKPGTTNFLGAISGNNGIREKIDAPFTWAPNCISVNYNGSVGCSYYQEQEFFASDDVNLCYAKNWSLDKYVALYFCSVFFKYSDVFNFGFKWSRDKMVESFVNVPVTSNETLDYNFMRRFISAIEKIAIRGVVKYKNEMLNVDENPYLVGFDASDMAAENVPQHQ